MTVTTIGTRSSLSVLALVDMRQQLDELQRQLGTGKKSIDYAGLGLGRGVSITLRSQLAALEGYDDSMITVGVRLDLAQSTLTRIDAIRSEAKGASLVSRFAANGTGQTNEQKVAYTHLDEIFSLLNTGAGERYLFAGKATDQPAVDTTGHILNGDGTRAGFKQVMAERLLADRGASGLGRLVIPAAIGTAVSVAEDVAGSPFGFKLASVSATLSGAVIAGPSGAPPALSIDFSGGNPNAGETVTLRLTLPDGSSENLTLTATNATPAGANEFTIGATPADTATNLQGVVVAAIDRLANTVLPAASGAAAANDFFNIDAANPPRRVAGPPFETATALVNGTSTDTVSWYLGEAGSDSARSTALARIDPTITVAYGMRANEQSIRTVVQAIAVFASSTINNDPNALDVYSALTQRTAAALDGVAGQQRIPDIEAELAGAQSSMAAAKARHQQLRGMAEGLLDKIEGIYPEEVGAQILALQTNLEATLQVTAMLYRTTLLNYL